LAAASPPGALCALIRLRRIAKRAFCHGIVKNQQGSTPEPLQKYRFAISKAVFPLSVISDLALFSLLAFNIRQRFFP
jgi:hypothetical protein